MNEATRENLRRKSAYVDVVQMHGDIPLPSWCDLSLTELCNRSAGSKKACVFCPRIYPSFYPNQKLHMDLGLAQKIGDELRSLNYKGSVVLCGYGEPMLHPQLADVVRALHGMRVEIVTNGDFLSPLKIAALRMAGISYFVVSMYDGPEQIEKFTRMFEEAGCEDYILRDRWHTEEDSFGLKLTNRGGTVTVGKQDPIQFDKPCHYLTYQLSVDWNGDVVLCPQDWSKRLKFGNLNSQSILDVWTSSALHKRRMQLIEGRRCESPCGSCNTDGQLHGFRHAPAWLEAKKARTEDAA
jgi:radical SAM protein with 4Fe4S-binding SPASM domain